MIYFQVATLEDIIKEMRVSVKVTADESVHLLDWFCYSPFWSKDFFVIICIPLMCNEIYFVNQD